MKKKQAEELRQLQEERKKEEERLARLRAEKDNVQRENRNKQQQQEAQKNERQKNQMKKQQQLGKQAKNGPKSSSEKPAEQTSSVPQSTFTRSLSDIIKDNKQQKRNDKPSRSIPDRQQRKKEESKGEPQKVDFGVKSLDQILKEKQDKEKEGGSNKKESDKSNSPQVEPKKNLSNSRVDELRKKNEQKFKTPTTQAVPKANEVPSPTTTSTAPKEAPKRVRDTPTSKSGTNSEEIQSC